MTDDVLRHMRDALHLGDDEIPVFYGMFLRTFESAVEGLRGAFANPSRPDFLAIRSATHSLVGFSRNIGAVDLGDAAKALNAAAHAGDAAACALGASDIEELYRHYRDGAPNPGGTETR